MDKSISNNIDKLFKNITNETEFEIMFNNYKKDNTLELNNFIDTIKYIKYRQLTDKYKLEISNNLDINYSYSDTNFNNYRITINNLDDINNIINNIKDRNNSIIYSMLVSKFMNKDNSVEMIEKIKDPKKKVSIDEYDIRIRLSEEKPINETIRKSLLNLETINKKILFRFKQRMSLILVDNTDYKISIDITEVKSHNNINILLLQDSLYEAEIDFTVKKASTTKTKQDSITKLLTNETIKLKKVIDNSYYIVDNKLKQEVVDNYLKLLNTKKFYGMNVVSVESEHLVDNLITGYSITDKADGERYQLFIYNQNVYLLSSNFDIKDTNIKLKDKTYNNTILDGELITLKNNKLLFACFDILYYKNKDIREIPLLNDRIKSLDDVLKIINPGFKINNFNGEYTIKNILEFNNKNLNTYLDNINKDISNNKSKYIISRKYYMLTNGLSDNEVYKYSSLLWNNYLNNSSKWNYELDGIIYTPLFQKYTNVVSQIKHKIYKWKPADLNTIDFYITFKKNEQTKQILNIYDNTNEEDEKNKNYRICYLHVGDIVNEIEKPVYFREDDNMHFCKLFLDNNIVKDIEGNIIQDNTVVEFYYNSKIPDINSRWIPLRTRYDKTKFVKKYKKKYGNFKTIANKVWKSILENNTINIITDLANDSTYNNTIIKIKNKLDISNISREKSRDEAYYTKISNVGRTFRQFHNFIKSLIIYQYCNIKIVNGKEEKLSVLDYGVGRGGDIQKFYYSKIKYLVGFDLDHYGIISATDGAISRYNGFKKKFPNFPKMEFGVADGGLELNYESQANSVNMNDDNKKLLMKYFGESKNNISKHKFDIVNCNFMVHFMLKSKETFTNYANNINNYLNKDGYLLITTLNHNKLHEQFKKNNGIIESYITDKNGKKTLFFRYKANYNLNIKDIDIPGLSYNAYMAWVNNDEDSTYEEYLVSDKYLINSLKEKSNMVLVESNSFGDVYNNYKHFMKNSIHFESDYRTKKFFMNVKEIYNENDNINAEKIFSFFNNYYIFKKI